VPIDNSMSKFEIRSYPFANLRVDTQGDRPVIRGTAVVFNSLSVDMGGWREIILPGAFTDTLADGHDIKALVEHDPKNILSRTGNGTLKLIQTDLGVEFETPLPNTSYANDLAENLRLENVYQCSFGFDYVDKQVRSDPAGPVVEVRSAILYEISMVTFPAYPASDVSMRSFVEAWKQEQGRPIGTPNLDRAKRLMQILDAEA
jgi:HK97 family phage prohead protease